MNDIICECGHSINKHYLDRPSDGAAVGYCTHYDEKNHAFCSCQKSPSDIAAADLARITAENVELKRLLIEQVGEHGWTNGGDYPDYCRTCENTAKQGHKADCKLDAVLRE